MNIPKELFRYDLAIVAILKNEGRYIKEWLDYHLLAGVEHFYLYDNDSTDNQAEVAKPYVDAGLVDYFYLAGKAMQYVAYNDAVNRFKFQCRYMAFIDADEFIFPKTNQAISDVTDEILAADKFAAGVVVYWQHFGSNGQETADYSRGVLERFIRRAPENWRQEDNSIHGNTSYKNIFIPYLIDFVPNCHYLKFLNGFHPVNENIVPILNPKIQALSVKKIALNHYHCKSQEEYLCRYSRGAAMFKTGGKYSLERFKLYDRNDVLDDGILQYRLARQKISPPKKNNRLLAAVENALIVTDSSPIFFANKMALYLTCLFDSVYLQSPKLIEQSLNAISGVLENNPGNTDIRLFIKSLPDILSLDNGNRFKDYAINLIPKLYKNKPDFFYWQTHCNLDFILRLLKGR